MDTEVIDYNAVIEQLQRENERLRMRILKLWLQNGFTLFDPKSIKEWMLDNYLFIVIGIMLLAVAMSVLETIHKFTRR